MTFHKLWKDWNIEPTNVAADQGLKHEIKRANHTPRIPYNQQLATSRRSLLDGNIMEATCEKSFSFSEKLARNFTQCTASNSKFLTVIYSHYLHLWTSQWIARKYLKNESIFCNQLCHVNLTTQHIVSCITVLLEREKRTSWTWVINWCNNNKFSFGTTCTENIIAWRIETILVESCTQGWGWRWKLDIYELDSSLGGAVSFHSPLMSFQLHE